jgi:hypothetical protein
VPGKLWSLIRIGKGHLVYDMFENTRAHVKYERSRKCWIPKYHEDSGDFACRVLTVDQETCGRFFEIHMPTIGNYFQHHDQEIRLNSYEMLRGNHLKIFKNQLLSEFGDEIPFVTKTTVLRGLRLPCISQYCHAAGWNWSRKVAAANDFGYRHWHHQTASSLIRDFEKLNILQKSVKMERSQTYVFGRYLALFVDWFMEGSCFTFQPAHVKLRPFSLHPDSLM